MTESSPLGQESQALALRGWGHRVINKTAHQSALLTQLTVALTLNTYSEADAVLRTLHMLVFLIPKTAWDRGPDYFTPRPLQDFDEESGTEAEEGQ